jgi:glucose dehydrogenase
LRGFVAAYDQATGKEVWRFWTVPNPGEPGSETWQGKLTEHRGGASWMTGTYDPQLDLLYWPTGNPGLDYNGDERRGDNLYSDSVLALEAKTGKLRWYFQFTPHDIHDWDAEEFWWIRTGRAGKVLWEFPTNQVWKASPMTYVFDNKQYIAIAAGQSIIAFGLPE